MHKILVIDDENEFGDATRLLLEQNGYSVISASDGLTGLRMAKSEQPELVLCDLNMAPVDGFMILSILRQQVDTAHIPFAIVSASREVESVRKGMLMGADEYVLKPFTGDELLETVGRLRNARKEALADSGNLILELQAQLGAPLERHVAKAMDRILHSADTLQQAVATGSEDSATEHREVIEKGVEVLTRAVANARLLTQIEKVAASADAVRILPGTESTKLKDVVTAEFGRHDQSERVHFDMDDSMVQIGATSLTRIIDELARNALLYSPPESTITVRSRQLDKSVLLDIDNESSADFSSDTTIQMRREDFESALPPGLGLRVAHNLVALHGGTLTIRRPGIRKVCIHLNLPA